MASDLFYNRDENISGVTVQAEYSGLQLTPSYGSSVTFSAKGFEYETDDFYKNRIPFSLNSLTADFNLNYDTNLSQAQSMAAFIESKHGETLFNFTVDGSGIYRGVKGVVDNYGISHNNNQNYKTNLKITVDQAPNLLNWSGCTFLNHDFRTWETGVAYKKYDVVYNNLPCTNSNNLFLSAENIGSNSWTKYYGNLATVDLVTVAGPYGGQLAVDKLTHSVSTVPLNQSRREQALSLKAGTYTTSVYVKPDTLNEVYWYFDSNGNNTNPQYPHIRYIFSSDDLQISDPTIKASRGLLQNGWVKLTATITYEADITVYAGFISFANGSYYAVRPTYHLIDTYSNNLLLSPNDFGSNVWTTNYGNLATVITSNPFIGAYGSQWSPNIISYSPTAPENQSRRQQRLSLKAGTYKISVYVRQNTGDPSTPDNIYWYFDMMKDPYPRIVYTFSSNTIQAYGGNITASREVLQNNWVKLTATMTFYVDTEVDAGFVGFAAGSHYATLPTYKRLIPKFKLNNFYYCKEDHTSNDLLIDGPADSSLSKWTQEFFFEPDIGLQTNVELKNEVLNFKNSFPLRIKTRDNNISMPISYKFTDISTQQLKSMLHFLENKAGYRNFRHQIPSVYNRPKVFFCPQWTHTYKYHNCHDLDVNFIEDVFGVIPTDT